MPVITGPIGRGNLQYTAMWKAAQRFTEKPVKFGAVSAEIVAFALQDRHYKSIPDRMFAHRRRLQRGISRAGRRRLPGDPDRGAADPSARGAQHRRQGDQSAIDGRGVQPHGERPARQDRGVGAFLLGQSVPAANVRAGAELQAGARGLQHGRRRRHHLRIVELGRHRSRSHRQDHHRQEDLHRRDRPPHAAGRAARSRWRRRSAPRSNTSRPSG